MAVGESKTASAIVIGSRNILPVRRSWIIDEVAVIDRVRMFIKEQPRLGGSRHLRLDEILLVLREAPVHTMRRIIVGATEKAENRVHGKAAVTLRPSRGSLLGAEVIVGRAFV